jgi:hypothetical protein
VQSEAKEDQAKMNEKGKKNQPLKSFFSPTRSAHEIDSH